MFNPIAKVLNQSEDVYKPMQQVTIIWQVDVWIYSKSIGSIRTCIQTNAGSIDSSKNMYKSIPKVLNK